VIRIFILFNILSVYSLLAQEMRFTDPIALDSLINSEAEESLPIASSSGDTLFFVRSFYKKNKGGKFAGSDIWMSIKEEGNWSEPTNDLGPINNKKNNAVIGISDDGRTIYLLDNYGTENGGIAFSRKLNKKWSKPEKLSLKGISKEGYKGYYIDYKNGIIIVSMRGDNSFGLEDLYVITKESNGSWSYPQNLGSTINSKGYEAGPVYLEPYNMLIFSSNGHPTFGESDLFYSIRLYNSWTTWTSPKNFGPQINTTEFESDSFFLSDSACYFISSRLSNNGDIYKTSVDFINDSELKELKYNLHQEADALLSELRKLKSEMLLNEILLFEYNQIILPEKEIAKIYDILEKTNKIGELRISLEAFSFEGNVLTAPISLNHNRIKHVIEILMKKGISREQIVEYPFNGASMEMLSETKSGGIIIEIRNNKDFEE